MHRSLLALAALAAPLSAQSPFATTVVDYSPGPGAFGGAPSLVLGGPLGAGLGAGSLDVVVLGAGGSVTLGFDVTLEDRPGADLTVFENGFLVAGSTDVFAEVAYVEVSTDGASWARFPSRYGPPSIGGSPVGTYGGLAGGTPVLANVSIDPESPFDPATSGGEPFDLADLAGEPAVLDGSVDLGAVHFVRLVDVTAGDLDSTGTAIGGPGIGVADFDAVAALHHTAQPAGGPVCDLELEASGHLLWRLGDPDGVFDLSLGTLTATAGLSPVPLTVLLSAFEVAAFDGTVYTFRSQVPLDGAGILTALALSIEDLGGAVGGDRVALQP